MMQVEQEAEDELIACDGLARDDEGEGELDGIVECQRIDC